VAPCKPIAEEVACLTTCAAIMRAAREAGLGIFFVPTKIGATPIQRLEISDPLSTGG